ELLGLRALQSAQATLLRNPDLTAAQKIVALAVINEAGWQASRGAAAQPPYRVYVGELVRRTGLSARTVSSAIGVLSQDGGLFIKDTRRVVSPEGDWKSSLWLTPAQDGRILDLLHDAAVYAPERPSVRQPYCPVNPEADVVRHSTTVCTACGELLSEHTQ